MENKKSQKYRKVKTGNVLLILGMFLIVFAPSVLAQHAKHKKQRKSLRETIAVVDSLRLQMRYAADHGYMLQWADTLINARLDSMPMSDKRRNRLKRHLWDAARTMSSTLTPMATAWGSTSFISHRKPIMAHAPLTAP